MQSLTRLVNILIGIKQEIAADAKLTDLSTERATRPLFTPADGQITFFCMNFSRKWKFESRVATGAGGPLTLLLVFVTLIFAPHHSRRLPEHRPGADHVALDVNLHAIRNARRGHPARSRRQHKWICCRRPARLDSRGKDLPVARYLISDPKPMQHLHLLCWYFLEGLRKLDYQLLLVSQ